MLFTHWIATRRCAAVLSASLCMFTAGALAQEVVTSFAPALEALASGTRLMCAQAVARRSAICPTSAATSRPTSRCRSALLC